MGKGGWAKYGLSEPAKKLSVYSRPGAYHIYVLCIRRVARLPPIGGGVYSSQPSLYVQTTNMVQTNSRSAIWSFPPISIYMFAIASELVFSPHRNYEE